MTNDDAGQPPFVLVPGACLGGWAWSEVADLLRPLGHEVHALTLTGLGERVHLASREVDLETHIQDVVNVLDYRDLDEVVLVGHSYSGIVVTGVADRRPERIASVVYLDCAPVPDGTAIADLQAPEQREQQRREAEEGGDGWLWPVPDRQTLITGTYGSAAGLQEPQLALIEARSTPHPYATLTSPLRLSNGGAHTDGRPRRVAIFCAEGGTSEAMVRELIEQGDPRADAFAADDWELHELPTGHWAMLSLPGPLAELLHSFGPA